MKSSDLPIASPCPFPVCKLEFDAAGNCTFCDKPVIDVSAGTEAEAWELARSGSTACRVYLVDAVGRIVFGRAALTATLVAAAGAALTLAHRLEPVPSNADSVAWAEPVGGQTVAFQEPPPSGIPELDTPPAVPPVAPPAVAPPSVSRPVRVLGGAPVPQRVLGGKPPPRRPSKP